ncbi:hypothetical protein HED22_09005 [Thalassospira sp. HF15]|uniref:hypothetical protein n=1 Tax=Thalassospira sp. HF15 TaxID=2722755 RepID=UPI0014319B08|nr:hypothetical protein [Thalassospira sp. HF15]NIY75781.1 hypothetical protein [Thalassospira sp. HF15]
MTGHNLPAPDWPGKVAGEVGHDRIAACLVMDIQCAAHWGVEVLSHVDHVRQGVEASWEMAMNAYILKVGPETSDILPVYDESGESPVTVRTADLEVALRAWISRLSESPD